MNAVPCRVSLDIAAEQQRLEDAHAREQDARQQALDELYSDAEKFGAAMTDLGDTLAYWNLSDQQLGGWSHGQSAPVKRALAQQTLKVLQSLAADRHKKKPLTEREAKLADLVNFEAQFWLNERTEKLMAVLP